MMNKYQKALDWLKTRETWNGVCYEELQVDIRYDEKFKILQELIDICSKPNSIKQKLDHIQDVLDCCYETDSKGKQIDNGWNNDVDCANEYLQDIKQSYSFRVEDTRIVNELSELLGCNVDSIKRKVQTLEKALDRICGHCALLSQDNTIKFEEINLGICFPEEHYKDTDGKFYIKKYLDKEECKKSWLTPEQIKNILLEDAQKHNVNEVQNGK